MRCRGTGATQARGTIAAAGAIAALSLTGCYVSHERTESVTTDRRDASADAAFDGGRGDADSSTRPRDATPPMRPRPRDGGPPRVMPCEDPQGVDLLLVLDDSGSIRPRDAQLRDRLRRLAHGLLRPQDRDGDGWEDWPRVGDLHFGVVSTSVQGTLFCRDTPDGRLVNRPSADLAGCREEYPRFLTYTEGEHDPDRFAYDTSCVAFGPRFGCTVEQPLEAMAKALLPRDAPFTYIAGAPRGDAENAGFLRDDSVLVVLFVGDEDDCSLVDPHLFDVPDAGRGRDAGPPILGCVSAAEDQLHSIERYVDVLRWLRPDHPERVVLGMIVGIAAGVVITDPRDDIRSCFGPSGYPRRMIELAREAPATSVLGSVCGLSETTFIHALAERIAAAACPG